jgi:hypothetical protein
MEERLAWKLASDRAKDGEDEVGQDNGTPKLRWRSLYAEERHKEKDPSQLEPRVDQWRMKERVRDTLLLVIHGNCLMSIQDLILLPRLELPMFFRSSLDNASNALVLRLSVIVYR